PKQVREWLDKKYELMSADLYLLTLNSGHRAQFLLLEERLVKWINEHRNEQYAVIQNMVVRKAKTLAETNEFKNTYPDIGSFKFSKSWLCQFLYRHNFSNRRCTTVSQHLPANPEEKQNSWDEVDPRLIVNSFKCCGVSVKMDGMENDLVFDYELLSENLADENDVNSKVVGLDINSEEYEEVDSINNVWK
ncbi:22158_t:CDS:2, partial [Racocetra persica]